MSQALQDCKSHAKSAAVHLSQALPKGCYKPVKPVRVHSDKKTSQERLKLKGRDDMKAAKNTCIKMFSSSALREQKVLAILRDRAIRILHIWWKTLRSQVLLWCVAFDYLFVIKKDELQPILWPSPSLETVLPSLTSSKGFLSFLCQYAESTWTFLPGKGNVRDSWYWELICTGLQNNRSYKEKNLSILKFA